ncbi:MAG: DUF2244 domain-containing protein [Henriciella sp.]|nr:DUF2244 domain-containing protein [Henriciella sp.]
MEPTEDTIYFDAALTPHRSLSPRAFLIVMSIIGAVSFVAGVAFISMGAFPVIGFFGLDVLIIWLAFRRNFRSLRQRTQVRVTAQSIELHHEEPGQLPRHVELPTAFVSLNLDYPTRKPSELRLSYGGKAWVIGRFLTPAERKSLFKALSASLVKAKSERFST